MSLLEVEDLTVTYGTDDGRVHAVNGVSFEIENGVNYGLAGESGSGKSTAAEALLGLLPDNGRVDAGSVRFKGEELLTMSEAERQDVLWEDIAYVPQSAMDALDPAMTCGAQIEQAIHKHRNVSKANARDRVRELFDIVGLDPDRVGEYPHEFSGGMRQRVTIAMALALEPDLIVADEPTTGLDVVVQDKIIDKILEIQERTDSSLLLITHEIGVIAETCDDLSILYGGKVMEQGSVDNVLINPTNPYTMGLKNSFPDVEAGDGDPVAIPGSPPDLSEPPSACAFVDRCPFATEECESAHPPLVDLPNRNHRSACHHVDAAAKMRRDAARPETWGIEGARDARDAEAAETAEAETDDEASATEGTDGDGGATEGTDGEGVGEEILRVDDLKKWYTTNQSLWAQLRGEEPPRVKAVDGVSFSVRRSEILGVAGESGCGKSTLGETVAMLEEPTDGEVVFDGRPMEEYRREGMTEFRRKAQIVFQDPFDSLNPRQTVGELVTEPLTIHGLADGRREEEAAETLERVGLTPAKAFLDQYPHELSGGQRQRVAIARALVLDPDFLVCDEPASMLDVSLKVNLLNLLSDLAEEEDIGIVYISHDLASLSEVSDRLAIMYLGRIVELGRTGQVVSNPKHPYTSALLAANPEKDPSVDRSRVLLDGEPPDPVNLPSGCVFAPRCPKAQEECLDAEPDLDEVSAPDQRAACYFPEGEGMDAPAADAGSPGSSPPGTSETRSD